MKSFQDLLSQIISAQERFAKDLDTAVKKAANPSIHTSLSTSYNDIKEATSQISKQQQASTSTLKEINVELDKIIKDLKTNKTKLHENYGKVLKDMESKKQIHVKAKISYEEAVKKAESAVHAFRQGCSANVGNDKAIRKLEDAVTSATKDLDRCHTAYLKAVRDCQASQTRYEQESAVMLTQFEEVERKRLQQYQDLLKRYTEAHTAVQQTYIDVNKLLISSLNNIDVEKDILTFIIDTYTGNPPEPHAAYEPRNTEIIPHYGDQNAISESQAHQAKQQAIHAHMMRNSAQLGSLKPVPAAAALAPSPNSTIPSPPPVAAAAPAQSMSSFFDSTPEPIAPVVPASAQATAQALYDFVGQEEGDLSFTAGDVITLISYDANEEWWHGSLKGNVGTFPRDYVQRVESSTPAPAFASIPEPPAPAAVAAPPPVDNFFAPPPPPAAAAAAASGLREARALYPFEGMSEDELSFFAGDILLVANEIDGWYEGEDRNGRKGIFPANYVELI